jgi:hypothetical protein
MTSTTIGTRRPVAHDPQRACAVFVWGIGLLVSVVNNKSRIDRSAVFVFLDERTLEDNGIVLRIQRNSRQDENAENQPLQSFHDPPPFGPFDFVACADCG